MWKWHGIELWRFKDFVSARDAFDLLLILCVCGCLLMLSACSAMPPVSPTVPNLPPLPEAIKSPPRPFPAPPGLPIQR